MKTNCVLVRFGEIGLKGKNRPFFEKRLVDNMRLILKESGARFSEISRIEGRFIVFTEDAKAVEALKHVFGIVSFSPALAMRMDLEAVKEIALKILNEKKPASFRVSATRLDKGLPFTSHDANERVGGHLWEAAKIPVKLKEPELDIGIDMASRSAYIFSEIIQGPGGLPVGVSGKVLCFLSGGIDSPVATSLVMKRGCECTLIHFLHGSDAKPGKILRLWESLRRYQPELRLLVIPFDSVEKEIIKNVPASHRIIILRRMFLRAAEIISKKEGALAVITGDNIGQVASQTLHNMAAIDQAADIPILRPLLGFDKEEIVRLAERIGTYKISIEPYEDCCTFMLPKHPETKARLAEVLQMEKGIDMELVAKAVEKAVEFPSRSR